MIDADARIIQHILNSITVGGVLTVEDQIKAILEIIANMYNHHHCLPNSSPGNIIAILVAKPQASTVLTFVQ
jgi:predicted ATP-dependent Lon-type protease